MLDLNPVKKLHRIKGNEPLLLNDSHQVWIVRSGAIALFAAKIQSEKPASNRHYLFSVGAGEALFGTSTPLVGAGTGAPPLQEGEKVQMAGDFWRWRSPKRNWNRSQPQIAPL